MKKEIFSNLSNQKIIIGAWASLWIVGCGGTSQIPINSNAAPLAPIANNTANFTTPFPNNTTPNTPTTNTTVPTTPTTPTTTPDQNLNSAYNYLFELQNSVIKCNNGGSPTPSGVQVGTWSTPPIATDNIFRVTLQSGGPSQIPCTGYMGNYSCIQVVVTVGAQTQEATLSYGFPPVGSPCDRLKASNSVTLNFDSQATEGHGPLSVQISQPQTDNCHNDSWTAWVYGVLAVQVPGCAMSTLYANQIVSGTISVVTNHM